MPQVAPSGHGRGRGSGSAAALPSAWAAPPPAPAPPSEDSGDEAAQQEDALGEIQGRLFEKYMEACDELSGSDDDERCGRATGPFWGTDSCLSRAPVLPPGLLAGSPTPVRLAASLQGRHLCPGPHARRGVGFGGRLQQHVPDLPRQHQAIRGDLALQGLVLCGVSPYLHAGAAAACELEQSGG
jgi:hypothetical protein